MIALALWGAVALASPPGKLQLDRVDVLSGTSASFLADDLPRLPFEPELTALRFASQVALVVASRNFELSSSLSVQSVGLRAPIARNAGLWVDGGLVARGLLPVGARAGLALRPGLSARRSGAALALGLGVAAETAASWSDPRWSGWTLRPTLAVGLGRDLRERPPWMQ